MSSAERIVGRRDVAVIAAARRERRRSAPGHAVPRVALAAEPFTVALYADAPEKGGALLGTAPVEALPGGARREVTLAFPHPGSKSLVAVADAGRVVREYDESNNRATAARPRRRAVDPR